MEEETLTRKKEAAGWLLASCQTLRCGFTSPTAAKMLIGLCSLAAICCAKTVL